MNTVVQDDIRKILEDVMKRHKFAKREMCKESPMTDNPPVLMIGRTNRDNENDSRDETTESAEAYQHKLGLTRAYDVAMLPLIHKEDVFECYTDAVKMLPICEIDFILLAVEGYMRIGENGNPLIGKDDKEPEYEHGDMAKDFAENPFTNVREGLVVSGVDWNEDTIYMSACSYTYDDNGVPIYGETSSDVVTLNDENKEMAEARFTNAMLGTMKYLKLAMKAQSFHDLLTDNRVDDE
jgi:hypothetical protein